LCDLGRSHSRRVSEDLILGSAYGCSALTEARVGVRALVTVLRGPQKLEVEIVPEEAREAQ
jgi:hypothetical protein